MSSVLGRLSCCPPVIALRRRLEPLSAASHTLHRSSPYNLPGDDARSKVAQDLCNALSALDTAQNASEQQALRSTILEATSQIQRSISTASDVLEQHQANVSLFRQPFAAAPELCTDCHQYQHLACIAWLVEFEILRVIPTERSLSYDAIAQLASVPVSRLKSVIRMAATNGILREEVAGEVSHTSASAELSQNAALHDWARFVTRYSAPTALRMPAATRRWGETSVKNETAHNIEAGTDLAFFQYIASSKEMATDFPAYMRSLVQSPGLSLQHVAEGFDWEALGEAQVVDIGGSQGHVSGYLAERFPKLRITVQDLPEVVKSQENRSQITFMAHDFFQTQPIKDADVYFMRLILHDWPDAEAREILSHLARVMKRDARILIADTVLPRPGVVPMMEEAALRGRDLTMAQVFNSKERECDEWDQLFAAVDPPLKLKATRHPRGSVLALLEVVRTDA